MAEYYVMGTGDIEVARETPVMKALLPLINQDEFAQRVAFHSRHGYPCSWLDRDFLIRMKRACKSHGIDLQNMPTGGSSSALVFMMEALYVRSCEIRQAPVDAQVVREIRSMEEYAFEADARVADVVRWLRLLDDGHGLGRVLVTEACTSNELVDVGTFGGGVLVDTPHVHFYQGTGSIGSDIDSMSQAIERGDVNGAGAFMADYASRALRGVRDPGMRAQILERAISTLQERFGQENENALRKQTNSTDGEPDDDSFSLDDVPH